MWCYKDKPKTKLVYKSACIHVVPIRLDSKLKKS